MDLSLNTVLYGLGVIFTPLGALIGAYIRHLHSRMKTLDTQHQQLAAVLNDHLVEVPKTYVTKVELKEDLDEIKRGINRVTDYLLGGNRDGR